MNTKESLLNILELPAGADYLQIKQAYRRLSKLYHPDLNHSNEAVDRFMSVHNAYQKLLNYDYFIGNDFANELRRGFAKPARAPLTEAQIIEKYRFRYDPPTNIDERNEWLIAVRARMKDLKRKKFEQQLRSYENFDKSPWKQFVKMGVYIIYLFATLAWMGIAILPIIRAGESITQFFVVGFIAFPAAWFIRKSTIKMRINLEPYFDASKRKSDF